MISGVLVLDKPAGPTSHDMVAVVRRALGERRIGHCGTLDPMATGVLALAVGPATRLVQFLAAGRKHYDATVRLGLTTTTYDVTGTVVSESPLRPTEAAVRAALDRFRGTIEQRPPAYSAKKVGGRRAHELARRSDGAGIDLPPVVMLVEELTLVDFTGDEARLQLAVSAGFFICISLSDLLPEVSFHQHDRGKLTLSLLLGIALAFAVENLPGHSHVHSTRSSQASQPVVDVTQQER